MRDVLLLIGSEMDEAVMVRTCSWVGVTNFSKVPPGRPRCIREYTVKVTIYGSTF